MNLEFLKPFLCVGCGTELFMGSTCDDCIQRIRYNSTILKSPITGIQGIAPLFYSISTTHQIFKRWKGAPGRQTENWVTRIHPDLHEELLQLDFWMVIPIPQNAARAWKFEHASAMSAASLFESRLNVPVVSLLQLNPEIGLNLKKNALMTQWDRAFRPNEFKINPKISMNFNSKSEVRILLVDDLITSGSTLSRAADTLLQHFPQFKIWAASLGYRPRNQTKPITGYCQSSTLGSAL